jgi:hypothetical protein
MSFSGGLLGPSISSFVTSRQPITCPEAADRGNKFHFSNGIQ